MFLTMTHKHKNHRQIGTPDQVTCVTTIQMYGFLAHKAMAYCIWGLRSDLPQTEAVTAKINGIWQYMVSDSYGVLQSWLYMKIAPEPSIISTSQLPHPHESWDWGEDSNSNSSVQEHNIPILRISDHSFPENLQ